MVRRQINRLFIVGAMFLGSIAGAADNGGGGNAASDRPNAVSFELFGRTLVYSFNYDREVSDSLAVGGGISSLSFSATTTGGSTIAAGSVLFIPIYLNYYFSPGHSRWFVTGGGDIISGSFASGGFSATSSGILFLGGGGYEYRGYGGFLFRANLYVLLGLSGGGAPIWPGFSFGYAF